MTKYYNPDGVYVAYCPDDKNLFNDDTEHIGYFFNGFLYSIKGEALGHVKGEKILDKRGQMIYYTK
jgi:hypothetical protein